MDYIIIVAGGKGLRMGGDVPKQFLTIQGKPILMRTMEQFHKYNDKLKIILVLPSSQHDYWSQLCKKYDFSISYDIADGGETRFDSVKNGLSLIPDSTTGIVGVHDGVRPFVSLEVINRCYESARIKDAVIPVIPVFETLRHIIDDSSKTVSRNEYRLVQTPQTFNIQLLKRAYLQEYSEEFTDDASVVEHLGSKITLVEGNRENIKITTPFDLTVAEALLKY